MFHKYIRFIVILLVLLSSTLACSFSKNKSETASNSAEENPTLSNNESDSEYLAEEYRSEGGGFLVRKAKGFEFTDFIGIINMAAPGANPQVGPALMLVGGIADQEYSNDEMFEKFKTDSDAIEISDSKKIKVDGVAGLMADLSGKYDDQPITGKVVVVMVTPTQQFNMIAMAPEPRWDELEPIFEAVLRSVEFFEPDPEAENNLPESSEEPAIDSPTQESGGGAISQWASSANASSEYGPVNWSAGQATGAPNVDVCGDNSDAWASKESNTLEWLELSYDEPVIPTEINIYQSFNPSQVVEVQGIDLDGFTYTLWSGDVEEVENCPDLMTITIELDEEIVIDKVVVVVDQSIWAIGWNEIDAVELVGYAQGGAAVQPETNPSNSASNSANQSIPDNFEGWMADDLYQGYASVVLEETAKSELAGLLGSTGKKSTDSWKPRPDHADTFIWDLGDDYKMFISVTTDGLVYKKSISPGFIPDGYSLKTVNQKTYDELNDIYARDLAIPYSTMANLLDSPGFLRESYIADGVLKEQYEWYGSNGYHIGGFFLDGQLTGIAGLIYIQN